MHRRTRRRRNCRGCRTDSASGLLSPRLLPHPARMAETARCSWSGPREWSINGARQFLITLRASFNLARVGFVTQLHKMTAHQKFFGPVRSDQERPDRARRHRQQRQPSRCCGTAQSLGAAEQGWSPLSYDGRRPLVDHRAGRGQLPYAHTGLAVQKCRPLLLDQALRKLLINESGLQRWLLR